jgi:hypothetical protein
MDTTGPEAGRRVSDAERAAVAGRLRRSYAGGYLSLETFSDRVELAVAAKTAGDLRRLVDDLPLVEGIRERLRRTLGRLLPPPAALPLSLPERMPGERFLIGRGEACDLVLGDLTVSRRHAELSRTTVGWLLSDLGSTNGTRVNGWRVSRVRIRPGDRVEIGAVRMRVTS